MRPIEAAWHRFAGELANEGIHEDVVKALRKAFFAGAASALLEALRGGTETRDMVDEVKQEANAR